MASSPTLEFLDKYSNDAKFYLSLPYLWTVDITNVNIDAIKKVLRKTGDDKAWGMFPNSDLSELTTVTGGLIVATEVTIPNEQSSFFEYGQENRGGFLPGYGIIQREGFLSRSVTVNFRETLNDIEHYIIRPWCIAVGIDGLVNHDLKADITVRQYSTAGEIYKGYKFKGAFPTNVEGSTLSYNDSDFTEKTATFGFNNYEQFHRGELAK